MILDENDLNHKTAEELFNDYMDIMYKIKPKLRTPKFKMLVLALKDAFMAGVAVASISDQDFKLELLAYATDQTFETADVGDKIH